MACLPPVYAACFLGGPRVRRLTNREADVAIRVVYDRNALPLNLHALRRGANRRGTAGARDDDVALVCWRTDPLLARVPGTDLHMHGTLWLLTQGETRKTKRVRLFTEFLSSRLAAYVPLLEELSASSIDSGRMEEHRSAVRTCFASLRRTEHLDRRLSWRTSLKCLGSRVCENAAASKIDKTNLSSDRK
jgi:hypothetical protein